MTKQDKELLARHYTCFKIFGKEFCFWDTSPRKVLEHLREIELGTGVKQTETIYDFLNVARRNEAMPDTIKSL